MNDEISRDPDPLFKTKRDHSEEQRSEKQGKKQSDVKQGTISQKQGTMSQSDLLEKITPRPAENSEAQAFLRSLESFSELPDSELRSLASSCRFANVAPGQYISSEGDEDAPTGFIVESGRLSMIKTSINGKELIVELLAPGDIFGIVEMLSNEALPLQLSSRAQLESRVLWVPVKTLSTVLDNNPKVYKGLVDHVLKRLQLSYRISRGLAHDKVEVRIASILATLALKFSRPQPAPQDNTIDITRQQIADLTGTTPETAIRVTRSMQRDGMIDIGKPGVVRVLDLDALEVIADE